MTTLANAAFASGLQSMEQPALELDGTAVRTLAAALPAFVGKAPEAQLEDYIVHVNPPREGTVQVVFEPRQPDDAPPTLGGATAAGPEVHVWVKTHDYSIDRISLAR